MTGKQKSAGITAAFTNQVRQALERFDEPEWLGTNSPLATPYFLGDNLLRQPDADRPEGRGLALRDVIRRAWNNISTKRKFDAELIEELFFKRTERAKVRVIQQNKSRSTLYRDQKRAIHTLEAEIIRLIRPALRLERPFLDHNLVGREATTARCLREISSKRAICLTGASGIGKTALATDVASKFGEQNTFWFTFRPGLNDDLESVLFSFGLFLQQRGRPELWLELLAGRNSAPKNEQMPPEVFLANARHALEYITSSTLLCFDDIDLLRPGELEAHSQILGLLDGLHGYASLLLIGVHAPALPETINIELDYLGSEEIGAMLHAHSIRLDQPHLAKLHEYTHGNPRLLNVFLALHLSGEPIEDMISELTSGPSLETLIRRLWPRLSKAEHQVLALLSILRYGIPSEVATRLADDNTIRTLTKRSLVQVDAVGGLHLLPAISEAVVKQLSADERLVCHKTAAEMRAELGEFTEGCFHLIQAGQGERAIVLWSEQSRREIEQGRAVAGFALLQGIPTNNLNERARDMLHLLLARLRRLFGDRQGAKKELDAASNTKNTLIAVGVWREYGDLDFLEDDMDGATRGYERALTIAESARLAAEVIPLIRADIAHTSIENRTFDRAKKELQLARFEIDFLNGFLFENTSDFTHALEAYRGALEIALENQFVEGEAKTRAGIAICLARLGWFDEANVEVEQASEMYRQIGRVGQIAAKKNDLVLILNAAGQYDRAVVVGETVLSIAEQYRLVAVIAAAAQNLAEAYLELDDVEAAERYVARALQEEVSRMMPDHLRTLGEIRQRQGRLGEAIDLIRQSMALASQSQDAFLEAYAWRSFGVLLKAQGNTHQANEAFEKAIVLFDATGSTDEVEKTGQRMSD